MALEHRHVDVRLAAPEAVDEAGRAQLDEVAKALVRGGEQREVIALGATVGASVVVDQIGLEAEDRLDPRSPAGLVVIDGAVHHAVVGEAERGHAEPAARWASLSILQAPSSSEYSLWTWRCATVPAIGFILSARSDANSG